MHNEFEEQIDEFWSQMLKEVSSEKINIQKGIIDSDIIIKDNDAEKFETYIFANFDICNFTKYKREHSDWVVLLQNFLYTVSNPTSDWSVSRFWKFNGDSLTFRKKVKSVDEICRFLQQTQGHLVQLQKFLNEKQESYKKIYVKAAVWIAGFVNYKNHQQRIVNNTRFYKSPFGEEFVGENIDEGFRLSSCSKAGKLVVDPKIVLIISLYTVLGSVVKNIRRDMIKIGKKFAKDDEELLKMVDKQLRKRNIYYDLENDKTRKILISITKKILSSDSDKFIPLVSSTNDCFYLMEYAKCKGVWDDRDYPIFWYIEDLKHCELVYDEIINDKNLRDHRLHKLIHNQNPKNQLGDKDEDVCYFKNAKIQLMRVCGQIEVLSSICQLVEHLTTSPLGFSEETIYDTANLYYMIACVVVKDGKDKGILIFKRTKERKHLKYVWDFVPIKHSRIYKPNEVYSICDYLTNMLSKKLNLSNSSNGIDKMFTIVKDKVRDSVKPYAFCNVYRNGESHNGILCVAEVNVVTSIEEFLMNLTDCIRNDPQKQYDDVQLVKLENIIDTDINIEYGKKIIKTLSPIQVKNDSDNVAIDDSVATFSPTNSNNGEEYGISYLGQSIKQILEERRYENERNKCST